MISRTDVRSVACPACFADVGEPCVNYGVQRTRAGCHTERWSNYRAVTTAKPLLPPRNPKPHIYREHGMWKCRTNRHPVPGRSNGACATFGSVADAYGFWLYLRRPHVRERITQADPRAAAALAAWDKRRRSQ